MAAELGELRADDVRGAVVLEYGWVNNGSDASRVGGVVRVMDMMLFG